MSEKKIYVQPAKKLSENTAAIPQFEVMSTQNVFFLYPGQVVSGDKLDELVSKDVDVIVQERYEPSGSKRQLLND